jgi:hypothetical protein
MPGRLLLAIGLAGSLVSSALAAPPDNGSAPEHLMTSDQVITSLNQTLAWYREARQAMRNVGSVFGREDEQTALAVLRSAFEAARAQAALLAASDHAAASTPSADAGPLAGKRTEVEAAVQADLEKIDRLQQRLRGAPRAQRPKLQDELAAATNRLELDRVRLDFLTKLQSSEVSASSTDMDVAHQIQALEESLPELRSTAEPAPTAAAQTSAPAGGNWGLVQRLMGIYHTQRNLDQLALRTAALEGRIGKDLKTTRASLHPVVSQLRALTADPSPNGSLAEGQKTFRALLQQSKQLNAVIMSTRGERALVRRFAGDLEGLKASLDRERWQIVQSLGVGLIGVVVSLAAILVGGMVWRIAAVRYVHDPYRRRLLLVTRNVVVVAAMTLVLVFHFASELTMLVTGLGFAAAGIAFALQNVILALAGYFSMVAPNGIRVGDRVSLQGPFGYVHGEVLEIGLVRIRLRELAGDPLRPTGRIVVFPNSVVFTGSFFKHPTTAEERGETPRRAEAA